VIGGKGLAPALAVRHIDSTLRRHAARTSRGCLARRSDGSSLSGRNRPHPRGQMNTARMKQDHEGHGTCRRRIRPPTRRPGRCYRLENRRCGQVFGLTSMSARRRRLLAVASQSRGTSALDGGRSRLPLRGSPRFTLGSLFSPAQPDTSTTRLSRYLPELSTVRVFVFLQCRANRGRRSPGAASSAPSSHLAARAVLDAIDRRAVHSSLGWRRGETPRAKT